MGAATSINSTSIVTKAVNNISHEIIQSASNSTDQNIIINVKNVQGDVEIKNLNLKQVATIDTTALFKTISEQENQNKINQQIEDITKSLISGLTLAQVSVSSSTVNSIVSNCIDIKDIAISECESTSKQNITVDVDGVSKKVTISDIVFEQISDEMLKCLTDSSTKVDISNQTDTQIKQLSAASAQGLDAKWLAIAAAVGMGGIGLVGTSAISNFMGPGMIAVGGFIAYRAYSTKSHKIKHDVIYILKDLESTAGVGAIFKIKNEAITQNDDVISHGDADIYETFGGNIILHSGGSLKSILGIPSQIVKENLEFVTNLNVLTMRVKNSDKYKPKLFTLPKPIGKILYQHSDDVNEGDVVLDLAELEFTHRFEVMYYDADKNVQYLETYNFEPTIISYKENYQFSLSEIFNDPNMLIGAGLIGLGVAITILKFQKKK